MDAMIFAAGLGTRLKPLTDRIPKALVPVGGLPMLERVARRLVEVGVTRIVVNVHAFPDQIEAYVRRRDDFGVEVLFSHERERPYETGGGLLAARRLFRRGAPILLHNVDVFSDLSLGDLVEAHLGSGALATLAVKDRASKRRLLFDRDGLVGRVDEGKSLRIVVRGSRGRVTESPFCGVHAIAPRLLDRLTETGVFPILAPYLRLAAEGERILPFRAVRCTWADVGRPADLERAEHAARS